MSLRPALALPWLLTCAALAACPGPRPGDSGSAPYETDWTYDSTPTIGPDDSDDPQPTDAAVVAWAGRVEVNTTPATGRMGFEFYPVDPRTGNWDDGDVLCLSATGLIEEDFGAPACPNCAFSWTFRGNDEAIKIGEPCDRLIPEVIRLQPDPGMYEGLEVGVGVGNYGMGRDSFYLYMPDYADYGWFLFTLDYPPIYRTVFDGDSLSWWRVLLDKNSGFPAYYYY